MYKVYATIGHWQLIDKTNEEQDVIDTIGEYIHEDPNLRFLVVENINGTDNYYKSINKFNDYVNYVEQFNSNQNVKKKSLKK